MSVKSFSGEQQLCKVSKHAGICKESDTEARVLGILNELLHRLGKVKITLLSTMFRQYYEIRTE